MPTVTRTWEGGGNNSAANPNDWSPTGVPQRGDQLDITHGTINISGNNLAGDTLSLAYSGVAGAVTNIDTQNNAILKLGGAVNGGASINVHVTGQLNLTAHVAGIAGTLTFIGGSINVVEQTATGVSLTQNNSGHVVAGNLFH